MDAFIVISNLKFLTYKLFNKFRQCLVSAPSG